jgi:4-amino-4-deoxy-L-arabinose transferase-like glycosyltransferase
MPEVSGADGERSDAAQSLGSLRPSGRTRTLVGFVLLVASTATFLTNAYYLQFAEPAVSRKILAAGLVAATLAWFAFAAFGLPRNRAELVTLLRRAKTPLLVTVILMVGFSLRYDGITSGLPQSYIPDEYEYVHSYLQMIKRGDMNPHWWHHPSVQPYVNVATYLVVFYLEAPTGRWKSVHEMQVEDVLFWGRLGAGVVPGTLAVLVVFLLGRWVFDTRTGLVAATLFAVLPGVVEVSQYNKPDSLLVLFSAVSILVTLVYLDRGGRNLALAAGLVVGLTVAVKYNAALLLIPFVLAVSFRRGLGVLAAPDLYVGALGSILGFVIGCPYFYADLALFIDHVGAGLYNYGYQGLAGASGADNWKAHAVYTARYGAGWWPLLASLVGLATALYRVDRRLLVFLAYPVLYYSFYSSQRINFAGNLMPVYPFLAVLASYGALEAVGWARGLLDRVLGAERARALRFEPLVLSAVVVVALWAPTSTTLRRNALVTLPDTGTMAAQWIESRFPPGTHFAVERHTPVLDRQRYEIIERKRVIDIGLNHLQEEGVEYLIVTSTSYQRFGPEHRQTKNYERLFGRCALVKEFEPEPGRLFGPTIRILQVPAVDGD